MNGNKSAIIKHPLWDKVKVKKGTKDPMTGLEIKEIHVPNEKYYEILEKLFADSKERSGE